MRQVAKKGLITAVAAGGVLAVTGGYAYADAGAAGTAVGSPGVLSGNNVQVPVDVPLNACGDTVDLIGALNPAFGSHCTNTSHGAGTTGGGAVAHGTSTHSPGVLSGNTAQVPVHVPVNACGDSIDVVGALNPAFGSHCTNSEHGAGTGGGGSVAHGGATGSPGVGSGNTVQVPVDVPVNACGDTVDVVGLLNPVFGNHCDNGSGPAPAAPSTPQAPPVQVSAPVPVHQPRHARPEQPGPMLAHTGAEGMGLLGGAGIAAMIGGFVLYRRGRALRG